MVTHPNHRVGFVLLKPNGATLARSRDVQLVENAMTQHLRIRHPGDFFDHEPQDHVAAIRIFHAGPRLKNGIVRRDFGAQIAR